MNPDHDNDFLCEPLNGCTACSERDCGQLCQQHYAPGGCPSQCHEKRKKAYEKIIEEVCKAIKDNNIDLSKLGPPPTRH